MYALMPLSHSSLLISFAKPSSTGLQRETTCINFLVHWHLVNINSRGCYFLNLQFPQINKNQHSHPFPLLLPQAPASRLYSFSPQELSHLPGEFPLLADDLIYPILGSSLITTYICYILGFCLSRLKVPRHPQQFHFVLWWHLKPWDQWSSLVHSLCSITQSISPPCSQAYNFFSF